MNRHIVTAIRCFLILLLPAVSYAISTQWAARGGKANKNEINAKPSQHAVAHSKGTASPATHSKRTASPAMHGKRSAPAAERLPCKHVSIWVPGDGIRRESARRQLRRRRQRRQRLLLT